MKAAYWIIAVILLPATASASAFAIVPEPASIVLLATGLAGLGIVAITRRRKR